MYNTLYIVVPCYNEEEVLTETAKRLAEKINFLIKKDIISENSKVLFVDDGSRDETWSLIEKFSGKNNIFSGVKLSRNRGHQNALIAGLMTAKNHCDMAISMDADLQDDINAIDHMLKEYMNGSDIVYGVRRSRDKDTFFKRNSAQCYYKLMEKLGVNIIYNHADYRLMSRRALDALSQFKEVNLFLRGVVPLIGFRYSIVEYDRGKRFAGNSKYPLKKMLSFAFDGITSFSIRPIRIITVIGAVVFLISIVMLIYSLIAKLFSFTAKGWTSLMCSIWMLGGFQILSLGVIGEYIGKLYIEAKSRPKYIIEKIVGEDNQKLK